jgi:hypothetical protein
MSTRTKRPYWTDKAKTWVTVFGVAFPNEESQQFSVKSFPLCDLSFSDKKHQLEYIRKTTAKQPDPLPLGLCALYALPPFNMDERGI